MLATPMPPESYILLGTLLGYMLGSIPFGLLLTRVAGLGDIRAIGSGSIGATNVLRTGRKGLAGATLLLDGLKGAAAVLIALWLAGHDAALWAGFGAILGHLFPVWLGFHGGKGVATGPGVLIAVAWPVGLGAGAIWLVVAKLARISSLAGLVSFATAPVLAALLADSGVVKLALAIAVLVLARHHTNIRRLIAGTEPRIGQKA
jgi:acyl phosphate:glycerol-3-phosphate acyltransferase